MDVVFFYRVSIGEKLTDDEVDGLLQGVEDSQGQVNYEGWSRRLCAALDTLDVIIHTVKTTFVPIFPVISGILFSGSVTLAVLASRTILVKDVLTTIHPSIMRLLPQYSK